jgi:hypothetical protein
MSITSYANLRYNQVRAKAIHNSYQRSEGVYDQVLYWRLRSLEFDLKHGDAQGTWDVYHDADNTFSNMGTLDAVAQVCRGINRAVPEHEVITIMLDVKDDFVDDKHTPDQLDNTLRTVLASDLFTPADMLTLNPNYTTLRDAAEKGHWPTLLSLRGKFIFMINKRDSYCGKGGASANARACFVLKTMDSVDDTSDYVCFYNTNMDGGELGPELFRRHLAGRQHTEGGSFVTASQWAEGRKNQFTLLGTDEVNAQTAPWAATDNLEGWPFQGIEVTVDPALREAGSIRGLGVNSGDIENTKDSFFFNYGDLTAAPDASYTAWLGSPASHVEEWAKFGLMARATTAADAPYFAVLRAADGGHRLRVQFRTKVGGDTTTVNAPDVAPRNTIPQADCVFVRLQVSKDGRHVAAWASYQGGGDDWVLIDERDMGASLVLHGLAASSHGGGDVRWLAGMMGGGPFSKFNLGTKIGTGVTAGMHFDGVWPPRRELASITSQSSAQDGQRDRSSGDFNVRNAPAHTLLLNWTVSQNADAASLGFNVMNDVLDDPDERLLEAMQSGLRSGGLDQRAIYIADPADAGGKDFLVTVQAVGLFGPAPVQLVKGFTEVASVMSNDTPEPGQNNRSSGNFSAQTLPAGTRALAWTVSENAGSGNIVFNVREDRSDDSDPVVFQAVKHRTVTGTSSARRLYVADPQNVANSSPFLVAAFAIDHLPPGSPSVGTVVSEPGPQPGQDFRSSGNFSTDGTPDGTLYLYWSVENNANAETIEFDVMEDVSSAADRTIFPNLKNGSWTRVERNPKLYIAYPQQRGRHDLHGAGVGAAAHAAFGHGGRRHRPDRRRARAGAGRDRLTRGDRRPGGRDETRERGSDPRSRRVFLDRDQNVARAPTVKERPARMVTSSGSPSWLPSRLSAFSSSHSPGRTWREKAARRSVVPSYGRQNARSCAPDRSRAGTRFSA